MAREPDDSRILSEVGYVHLHVHSSYSLLEGALMVGTLAKMAAADGQPALALTDTDNMFGALEFSDKMAGVRHPADRRAVELAVDFGDQDPNAGRGNAHGRRLPSRHRVAGDAKERRLSAA